MSDYTDTNTNTKPALWNRDFVQLCLGSFFLFFTFYTMAATLPVYVLDQMNGTKEQVGFIMTAFIIAAVIMRPLAGRWVDRFGGKKIVVISLALSFAVAALHIGVSSMPVLMLLRFLQGAGFGAATTAMGAVAGEMVPERRRGEGIGYYSLFMSLSMAVGPFVGLTVIGHYSFQTLFVLCAVTSAFSLLFGCGARMPKAKPAASASKAASAGIGGWVALKAVPISIAGFFVAFVYSGITTFVSVYANEISLGHIASLFFVSFAVAIVVPRPFTGKIFDRYGPNVIVYPGIVFFALGMVALSQVDSSFLFLAAGVVLGLGYGVLLPSFQTLAIQAASAGRRALATSTFFLLFDLGYGLGSFVLGILASRTHYDTMYLYSSAIVGVAALLYYALHHRKQMKPSLSRGHDAGAAEAQL